MDIHSIRIQNAESLKGECSSTADFARKIGKSPVQVRHWFNPNVNKNIGNKIAREIETAFYKPHGWLDQIHDQQLATIESNIIPTPSGGLIPLISFVQAGDWAECIDNFAPGDAEDWLPCPSKHSPSTFAVHVKGDSMTAPHGRTYPEGCIIFVDPEQEARAGDRVIAKLTDVNEATFKVLIEDNGMTFLKPLNPQYHTMQINGNCKIVGKVIGSYFPE